MAEENVKYTNTSGEAETTNIETKDRGLFGFMGKKDEEKKPQAEDMMASEFDQKVQLSEEKKEEEKKPGLLEKLRRSDSSSSEEEVEGEDGVKIKRKKGLKEKIKEKISRGEKAEEVNKEQEEHHKHEEETHVPVEVVHGEPAPSEEKRGFLDKIKEKFPGGHAKKEDVVSPTTPTSAAAAVETDHHHEEGKEKKGFLDKIKEKLPGYHPKSEEEKEKDKESGPAPL